MQFLDSPHYNKNIHNMLPTDWDGLSMTCVLITNRDDNIKTATESVKNILSI